MAMPRYSLTEGWHVSQQLHVPDNTRQTERGQPPRGYVLGASLPLPGYRCPLIWHDDMLHASLQEHISTHSTGTLAGGLHACMASPIWKAMWSAGTLTCATLLCWSLMYSPAALSGQGTSCPCFMYMALVRPACTDCIARSLMEICPPDVLTCSTLPRWSLMYVNSLCASKDTLRQQDGALTPKQAVGNLAHSSCGADPVPPYTPIILGDAATPASPLPFCGQCSGQCCISGQCSGRCCVHL
jgi:hypothetical protein